MLKIEAFPKLAEVILNFGKVDLIIASKWLIGGCLE
jgi:hypothetical protein